MTKDTKIRFELSLLFFLVAVLSVLIPVQMARAQDGYETWRERDQRVLQEETLRTHKETNRILGQESFNRSLERTQRAVDGIYNPRPQPMPTPYGY